MIIRTFWLDLIKKFFKTKNIIWLYGVRRAGKTFLCRMIPEVQYFDCEIPEVRREVESEYFLRSYKNKIIALDEIHKLKNPSELLKIAADYYPMTKIIATGSSTLNAYKRFRDTLTGRKYNLLLTPFIHQDSIDFNIDNIHTRLIKGGLPPFIVSNKVSDKDYNEWIDSY